jgi:hypothetical protein
MLTVSLSRLDLAQSGRLRRVPPRPPEHRQPGYDCAFDFLTVLYDCFAAPDGRRVVCLGPPLLNLEPVVVPAIERAFGRSWFSFRDVRRLDRNMQIWLKPRAAIAAIEGGYFEQNALVVQPNHCDLFLGKRVLLTKSKDNELVWIRDWVSFHAANHGCNAVLFYDNGSAKYTAAQVHQAIASVAGIEVAVVVSWPFKFGVNAGPTGIWDSDFGQYGVLEHAHHRFLAWADAVINADIDELVMTGSGVPVFDLALKSRTGYLKYAGVMIENATDAAADVYRHGHFVHRQSPPRYGTEKWTVVPSHCRPRSQWCVHSVTRMKPDQRASANVTHRHFMAIRTGWKYPRMPPERPGAGLEVDTELAVALHCFGDVQRDLRSAP